MIQEFATVPGSRVGLGSGNRRELLNHSFSSRCRAWLQTLAPGTSWAAKFAKTGALEKIGPRAPLGYALAAGGTMYQL